MLLVEVHIPVLEQCFKHGAGAHIVPVHDGVLGGAQVGAVVHKGGSILILLTIKTTAEVVLVIGILYHRIGKIGALDLQIAHHIGVLAVKLLELGQVVPGHSIFVAGQLLVRTVLFALLRTLLRGD